MKFSSPKRNGMRLAHMRDSSVSFTSGYRLLEPSLQPGWPCEGSFSYKKAKKALGIVQAQFSTMNVSMRP